MNEDFKTTIELDPSNVQAIQGLAHYAFSKTLWRDAVQPTNILRTECNTARCAHADAMREDPSFHLREQRGRGTVRGTSVPRGTVIPHRTVVVWAGWLTGKAAALGNHPRHVGERRSHRTLQMLDVLHTKTTARRRTV